MTLEVEAALGIDIIFMNFRSEAPTCHQGVLFEKSGHRGKSGGNISRDWTEGQGYDNNSRSGLLGLIWTRDL